MKLSRRNFALSTLTMAGAPYILRGQPATLRARVKIDTERVIGDIDPMLYGNFIEHLGRCIDGGIFEEKSPLSDSNGFRKDVLEAVRKLNVTLLRWPGGNFSSNYNWRDGIGPRDQRPPRLEMAWGTVGKQPFRHPRVPQLRGDARDAALHLRQPRHRRLDRSPAVGRVLQFRRRHRHDPPAPPERTPRSLEGQVLGPR